MTEVRLLSGGNPQIPKGDGEAPVRAWIAAMPGWKREASEALDALIEQAVPGVARAVRWNSPFYGTVGPDGESRGWFVSCHGFTRYIKVTFFEGRSMTPVPPVGSKDPKARYVHISEDEPLDAVQMADWLRQAAALPGWKP
jgi:hypothetical protein